MAKMRGVRLSDETSAWVDEYAAGRDLSASDVLRTAVEAFKADCTGGVPDVDPEDVRPPRGPARKPKAVALVAPRQMDAKPTAETYAQLLGQRQARLNKGRGQ